ncbi:LysR family transcriptional regulator [Luteipulveratus halotolerans]|uniref:HTH lysR-type domain-containing protein n=1 Tax=Luteipulveratus halotolerans TaxID=1631356 RepID=A0A0L6CML7_9MICO|nr:LysR family transcriptional regulator [Luteipulveratus halotolerans]KNX39031.1 hypothetical protein VV01_20890 [Luteipulveratus halotolerans]
MDVDAGLLRAFLVVADEGTMTAAARRLFVSQPALSGQIRRLVRATGLDLFVRLPVGVRLTTAGEAFAPYAEQALAALERGVAEAAAVAGRGSLRLDVLDPSLAVPRRAVARLRERLPQLTLEVTGRGSVEQVRRLRAGDLDVALTGTSTTPDDLTDTPLLDEPLGVAVAAAHPLARATDVHLDQLTDDVHYLPRAEFAPEWVDLVVGACRAAGFEPRLLPLRTESAGGPLQLVAAGECVAVSLLSTPAPQGVVMVPLTDAPAYRWVVRTAGSGALVTSALAALHGLT